jgi:dipeptidyl aminopeptidase/acylaminoacyl peptidase
MTTVAVPICREWDTWRHTEKVHQIFLTELQLPSANAGKHDRPIFLAPFNASSIYSKMNPFDSPDYDISWSSTRSSSIQVAVQIKDRHLNDAFHTRRHVYYTSVPIQALSTTTSSYVPTVRALTAGEQGAVTSVKFSPSGEQVVWAEMRVDGFEADRNRIVSIELDGYKRVEWTESWDRSPSFVTVSCQGACAASPIEPGLTWSSSSFQWSHDSKSLYLIAENEGSILPYHLTHPGHLPTPLIFNGSTTSIIPLSSESLLIGRNSFVSPVESFIISVSDSNGDGDKVPSTELTQVTSWSHKGLKHKRLSQGEKFWFKGAEGVDVMGWIVKPPGWKEGGDKKYPMGEQAIRTSCFVGTVD